MLIVLVKIIEAFVLPPGLFVSVPFVFGLLWLKSSKKKALLLLFFSLLSYLLTTSIGTFLFIRPLEKSFQPQVFENCDAVIVLGGGIFKTPDGYELRPHAFKRIVEAIQLAKKYDAVLIVSGGTLPGTFSVPEASIMAELARRFGLSDEKILLDLQSRNTYENAKNVTNIVRQLDLKRPVLVTSAVHMKRAVMSFKMFNLEVQPHPVDYLCDYGPLSWVDFVPTRESLEANMLGLHEVVGLLWYKLSSR
ncbi:hypothetical protein AS159_07175 [Thermotoga sp. Ku-13t]|uniref:YdcF family protein n=1 Tax=Thermotoga sp. Ku-13t TaxID=1755813 RepID=UPI0013ECF1E3|nr:YdcF family protein [Thermotoga sp. Ku-13t]KAF2957449.1 hypothetical protein AS159_07175 [Thermotoga sp. Ku-13t]